MRSADILRGFACASQRTPKSPRFQTPLLDHDADDHAHDNREWDVEGIDGFKDCPDGSLWYLVGYKGFGEMRSAAGMS